MTVPDLPVEAPQARAATIRPPVRVSQPHRGPLRADEVGATTVAFPSISTGAYGYPLADAAAVSMRALCGAVTAVQSVLLVAFSSQVQELWEQALEG